MRATLLTRLRRRAGTDGGFSLVELLIAMVIFSIAIVGIVPLFLGMTKTAVLAKTYTQARNLAQDQFESMRQLPYHVDASNQKDAAGNDASTSKVDLGDTYYPNLVAATNSASLATATSGYVAAAATHAPGEPAGALYRTVTTRTIAGESTTYRMVVSTQFLTGAGSWTTPTAGYSYSDKTGLDELPSTSVGVTLQVAWTKFGSTKTHRTYTRIDQASPTTPLVTAQARAELLRVTSTLPGDVPFTADLASANADGASAAGITASADTIGAAAAANPGVSIQGARAAGSAPPTATLGSASESYGFDYSTGCAVACFGQTSVSGGSLSVDRALPLVGYTSTGTGSPLSASLNGKGTSGRPAFRFNNMANRTDLLLQTGVPLVDVNPAEQLGTSTASGTARGTAYAGLFSTPTTASPRSVTANAGTCGGGAPCPSSFGAGAVIDVMPTTFTPVGKGVVQIQLFGAQNQCKTDGTTATVTASWRADVWVWQTTGYVKVGTVQNGGSPLPDPSTITVTSISGAPVKLSAWVQSWFGLTSYDSLTGAGGNVARGTTDGIVTLSTVNTRDGEPASAITLQVSPMSCYAEDNR